LVKRVALIRGDGVGPELVDCMLKVLKAVEAQLDIRVCEAGYEWWLKHGGESFIPKETWEILENSDACFKGPTTTPPDPNTPRSVAVSIRQRFNLYANIRPIKTFKGAEGPLGPVDFICVREATEGLYSGLDVRLSEDTAITVRKITRSASMRVARRAFEEAVKRSWSNLIVVTKRNILKETDSLFFNSVLEVGKAYPNVKVEEYYIDNFAQQLIKNPQRFNQHIILSTNLFMDIISEAASALVGSIGMIYSGNFGDNYAMFEPAHGSSPKYKGLDKVNPTATILAGAWMLEYLGDVKKARAIFEATEEVIAEKRVVTYDLGGSARSSEMAEEIARLAAKKLG
jgi:isocitrate dehydrogenase